MIEKRVYKGKITIIERSPVSIRESWSIWWEMR